MVKSSYSQRVIDVSFYILDLFALITLHPPVKFSLKVSFIEAVVSAEELVEYLCLALAHLHHGSPVGDILWHFSILQMSILRFQGAVVVTTVSRIIDMLSGGVGRSVRPANALDVDSGLIWSPLATAGDGLVVVFSSRKYQQWAGT